MSPMVDDFDGDRHDHHQNNPLSFRTRTNTYQPQPKTLGNNNRSQTTNQTDEKNHQFHQSTNRSTGSGVKTQKKKMLTWRCLVRAPEVEPRAKALTADSATRFIIAISLSQSHNTGFYAYWLCLRPAKPIQPQSFYIGKS